MNTPTKKEIIILAMAIILIAILSWAGIKMIEIHRGAEKTNRVAEKKETIEDRITTPFLVGEKVYLDGEVREINSEKNYLIIIPTWVDARLIDKIPLNKKVRINIIPGKTSLSRLKLIEPKTERVEELKEPEIAGIKIADLKIGEKIHIEGKWNLKKDILEPLSIVAVELVNKEKNKLN